MIDSNGVKYCFDKISNVEMTNTVELFNRNMTVSFDVLPNENNEYFKMIVPDKGEKEMKTFIYNVEYNEQEARTIATIDISETIKAIEEKYPGMLAAYRFLTGDIAFPTVKFTGVARLNPRDIPIPNMGRQFALMKARRKAKKYLKKQFFEMQKAFSKASEDAFNSRLRYDILAYEEDNSILHLVDSYDGNKKPASEGYTGEIYIYERGKNIGLAKEK